MDFSEILEAFSIFLLILWDLSLINQQILLWILCLPGFRLLKILELKFLMFLILFL